MSSFNPSVQPTNDPSYLNSSRGTDNATLQPLASVPELSTRYERPNYYDDKSAGTAIKGVGDLADAGLKLADAVIKQKADDTLTKGINDIRDSFGVAQAADQGSQLAKAVGQAGAEGVSLTGEDTNQPVAINRLGNKVEGLTEAYRQGGLSNSAYYAKLEAFVKETKAQFPGYSNDIDSMVATKVGTTPANALRGALLQDVTNLQSKVQAQNDKWTTYEHSNTQYIHTQWPNYEQLKAEGRAPSRLEVEYAVGQQQSRDYQLDTGMKRLAASKASGDAVSDQAYDIAIQKAGDISRNTVIGMTNTMEINTAADLQKYITDVNAGTRKPPTPDEKTQLTGLFSILKQKASSQFDQFANQPLAQNTTETLASKLRSPEKLASAKTVALGDIGTIEDGLLNDKHGIVASTLLHNKAVAESADNSLLKNDPNAAIYGAVRRNIGDNALATLFNDAAFAATGMEGLRQAGWVDLTQDKSARETLDTLKKESNNNGELIRKHLEDSTKMVIHQDQLNDKDLGQKAFNHLFGEGNRTLLDAFQDKVQTRVFTDLVSPQMTKAVAKRNKSDQTTYVNWAEDGFTSVFQTQAMGANQTADNYKVNGNLTMKYNPDAQAFQFEGARGTPTGMVASANSRLAPLNSAISSMKEVFKLTGKDPTAELYRLLPIAGIEPGTSIYKAIQEEFLKTQKPKEG